MKTLLRSVFLGEATDSESLFAQNYHALIDSGLGFDQTQDVVIWNYIQDFFKGHGHLPSLQTIRTHFERVQENEVIDRLERLAQVKPRTRGDFLTHLESKAEDRRTKQVLELAKEMATIAQTGLTIKDIKGNEHKLLGAVDAVRHILDRSHDLVAPTLGGKLSGNVVTDGDDFLARYDRIKNDPQYGIGCFTGIRQVDEVLKGAKKHELWVHAGFTGSLKSSFALQWVYNQAVYYRNSSVYFSLEMPYTQVRNMLYVMHTAHEKFAPIREKMGIKGIGLDYEKLKNGLLSPNEEQFLREYVVPDFNKKSTAPPIGPHPVDAQDYGDIFIEVADPDKSDFNMVDLRSRAELIYSKTPFSMIVVDHAGLMGSRKRYGSTTESLNEVIRDLKKMAMGFNRGMGIAVLTLFQISREGYRSAEKNGGKYNLTHLSYSNECLSQGTPIPTNRGVVPIEEVRPGMQVWSRSGWKQVLDFFDQGVRPVWRVTNDRGEHLDATENHRLRVLRNEEIQWCRVDGLQEGDWLLSTEGCYPWPESPPSLFPLPEADHPVEHLTESLSYLLGVWDGDGCYRRAKIAFTGNRKEKTIRQKIQTSFREVFGEELLSYDFKSRPGSFDEVSLANPTRTFWFESVAGPRGEKVPEVIWKSPCNLVSSYLKGLFDTDGWVNNRGIVGLKMKNEGFLREVQLLLTNLGIDSKLEFHATTLKKTGKTYPGWTLRIRGSKSKRLFQKRVGFSELHKQNMLESTFVESSKDKRVYPVGRLFASLASEYTPYAMITSGRIPRSHYNAVNKATKDGLVSRGAILTLLKIMEEDGIQDVRANLLKEVLSRKLTRVVKISKHIRDDHVFDIQVDGDHEFQSGPFLSHNCERSADILTTSWIDDDLRKINRALLQCLKSRDQAPFERCPMRVEFTCRRIVTDNTSIDEIENRIQATKQVEDDGSPYRKRPQKKEVDFGFGG